MASPTTDVRGRLTALNAELSRRRRWLAWEDAVPKVLRPLVGPARYKAAHGGRGGAKSHFFAENLIHRAVDDAPFRAVCVREVQRSLDQSVKRLLEDKIDALDVADKFRVKQATIDAPRGGLIIFQGMQDHTAESIKSLEGFDVAWVEEAQALSERSLTLLRPTIRKERSEIWFSWNPQAATDPVDVFFRGGPPPPDSVLVETNFDDNPYFPDVLRRELEWDRTRDKDKYEHVWLGKYRKASEARVFKNWRVEEHEAPQDAAFLFGADWGFSIDPAVLVRAYARERTLYVDHEAYEVGCEVEDTPDLFDSLTCGDACARPRSACKRPGHGMARRWQVTADSARPETISHMKRHGYEKMEPSVKGARSVEEGVSFLQSFDIVVHPRCKHTIDELSYYEYKTDPLTGAILPVLKDKKNHVIDSLRYAVERLRRSRKAGLLW